MPTTPTRLLVLRHGRSEWNAQNRWQGHADIPLDDIGRAQAREVGERVSELGNFVAVHASDLRRALETAEIVAASIGIEPVHVDPRLRENDVGPWEGLDHAAVEAGWPGYLAAKRRPDGFESYDVAAARMTEALVDIARAHPGEDVIVVGHGGITRATRRALGVPDPHLPNLGGCWFFVDEIGLGAGDVVDLREHGDRRASDVL